MRFSADDFFPREPTRKQRMLARKIETLKQAQALLESAISALRAERHNRGVALACDADTLIQEVFTDEQPGGGA